MFGEQKLFKPRLCRWDGLWKIFDMNFSGKVWASSNKSRKVSLNTSDIHMVQFLLPGVVLCPSEGGVSDSSVHLQRRHLHILDLDVLGASRRAVSGRASHRTEAHGGATRVRKARRPRHSRTPQEASWCHQVPVALRVREGVARAAGAGAADAGAARRRGRGRLGLPHLVHHLKVWADCDKVRILERHTGSRAGCPLTRRLLVQCLSQGAKPKYFRQRLKRGAAAVDSLSKVMCFLNIRAWKPFKVITLIKMSPLNCSSLKLGAETIQWVSCGSCFVDLWTCTLSLMVGQSWINRKR